MNLRFVETFLWVARLGSFSAAAERLNTTQAAISNRIATLERDLGVRLFERDSRSIRLSAVGQQAVSKAEELVRVANAFREAASDPTSLRGSIRIGTIDSIVHAWLPQLIERIRERYPSVAIDLNTDTSLNLSREVADRRIDLALIMGPVMDPDLVNLDLCTFACTWLASPKLHLPAEPLSLAEIAHHPFLAYSKDSLPHHRVLRLLADVGIEDPTIYNSNSLATIIRLAKDGIGVTPLPTVIVRDHLEAGTLVALDVQPAFPPLVFYAVYSDHPDNLIPAVVARMAQEVARGFSEAQTDGASW
ncbi:LysR family transcriptional regulator [Microvirga brassicacearum]|uniref:LysR family transcriptional regulator n=1 Tax=Microvirga brassicacearum TaxID=2580413 RepID=A0A5N3P9K2_9HYPH|nr:LysR family transcriptional regulator [Microvirga brassicacearum]KAB0266422.1 LysR family transcriptional regulator [Microvirga brassicacearum]